MATQPKAETTGIIILTEPNPRPRPSRPPQPQVAPSVSKTQPQGHAVQGARSGDTQPGLKTHPASSTSQSNSGEPLHALYTYALIHALINKAGGLKDAAFTY